MVWGAEDKGDIVIVAAIRPDMEEVEAVLGKDCDEEAVKTVSYTHLFAYSKAEHAEAFLFSERQSSTCPFGMV